MSPQLIPALSAASILSLVATAALAGQQPSGRSPGLVLSGGVALQQTGYGEFVYGLTFGAGVEYPEEARLRLRAEASASGFLGGSDEQPSCAADPPAACSAVQVKTADGVYAASVSAVAQFPIVHRLHAILGVGVYNAPRTVSSESNWHPGLNGGLGWTLGGEHQASVELRYHRPNRDLGLMVGVLPITISFRF